MTQKISLKPMTAAMYHAFFEDYQNDPDLYLDPDEFMEYIYKKETVDAYIQRQADLHRLPFAILYGEQIVGELKLYDIVPGESATLGITMQRAEFKDRGYGTQTERLAVKYAFEELGVPVVYADCVRTNTRSQHVLEKVGFQFLYEDETRKHYRIIR